MAHRRFCDFASIFFIIISYCYIDKSAQKFDISGLPEPDAHKRGHGPCRTTSTITRWAPAGRHCTRFRKGQSGNPGGRSKKNLPALLADALNEPVFVTIDGERRKITKREAVVH